MTERQVEYILLGFPAWWTSLQEVRAQRQAILDEYRSAAIYEAGRMGQGSHSDMTAKKAQRLTELDIARAEGVREWLTKNMTIEDQILLVNLWRKVPLRQIAERYGFDAAQRWRSVLSLFAGDACAVNGPACASIRGRSRRDW